MKKKLIIAFSVIILIIIAGFMFYDFFCEKKDTKNVYKYDIKKFKQVNDSLVKYEEIKQIKPAISKLRAVAVDKNDNIYVTGEERIIVYSKFGKLISNFDIKKEVLCITVSPTGKIYTGTWELYYVWNKNGVLEKTVNAPKKKSVFTSIAVNENNVFLADAGNKIIYKYDLEGNFIKEIGKKDSIKGIPGFFIPSPYFDLVLGRDNELWAVNSGRHSFEAYNFNGELISSWKRTSMDVEGFSGCCNPSNIALLSNGSFVTSEKGIERVKIHSQSGDFICIVAGSDKFENGTKGIDLAVDSKDRVIVLDPRKGLIRIFEKK